MKGKKYKMGKEHFMELARVEFLVRVNGERSYIEGVAHAAAQRFGYVSASGFLDAAKMAFVDVSDSMLRNMYDNAEEYVEA